MRAFFDLEDEAGVARERVSSTVFVGVFVEVFVEVEAEELTGTRGRSGREVVPYVLSAKGEVAGTRARRRSVKEKYLLHL